MYTIERNIPMPGANDKVKKSKKSGKPGRDLKYPFPDMKKGDSFEHKETGVSSAGNAWAKRNNKKYQFKTVKMDKNKYRTWRVK